MKHSVKYYTVNETPDILGEVSKLPSETRQSDNIDIKETIARFFRAGGVIPEQQGSSSLTPEEKEAMFDGMSEQDLVDADLVEQQSFIQEVQGKLNQEVSPTEQPKEEKKVEDNSAEKPTESAKAD